MVRLKSRYVLSERRSCSAGGRADLVAEAEFYEVIFRWNADQMQRHLK